MRPVVVLVGILLLNALLLPPLLRWVARSAAFLGDRDRRGRVLVRWVLDGVADALMSWRVADRHNEATSLLFALAVTAALLVASALTLARELPAPGA